MPAPTVQPEHRTILVVDIEGFSRPDRTDLIRLDLRRRLKALCDAELERVGVTDAVSGETGDGYIYSFGPSVTKPRILNPLIPRLANRLERGNRRRSVNQWIRLRCAVHAGEVLSDPNPWVGGAAIHAFRMLDADVLRACLKATALSLVLIVSQTIYDSIVSQGYSGLDPAAFHPVIVAVKETRKQAWVWVPGDHGAPLRAGVVATAAQLARPEQPEPPQELPEPVWGFTARRRELDRLDRLFGGDPRDAAVTTAVVITGRGGVGKSALAIEAANRLARRYPDGQLYADLHGATPNVEPLPPLAVLQHFLRSLGVSEAQLPITLDGAAGRYRSLLAGKRMLVVLDNAKDARQVRPLLPGGRSCGVLITSRRMLGELESAAHLQLEVLAPDDAVQLLRRLVDSERIDHEPEAARQIARACDHLPLALNIVASRLRERPSWTVGALAVLLADEHHRLHQLRVRDRAVRASLDVSLRDLTGSSTASLLDGSGEDVDAVRTFRLLGLLDVPDIGTAAAAAVIEASEPATESVLERLVYERLLENPAPDRYRFHDLVRLLARDHAVRELSPAEQDAAHHRLLGFYLPKAEAADRLLRRGGRRLGADDQPAGHRLSSEQREALRWLEVEHAGLVATVCRAATIPSIPSQEVSRLAEALTAFLPIRSRLDDWERIGRAILALARARGDRHVEAQAYRHLGLVASHRYQLDAAAAAFERSRDLCRAVGDLKGEEQALGNLGILYRRRSRYDAARAALEAGLAIGRELGDDLGVGHTLAILGTVYRLQSRHDDALDCYRRSLELCREHGDLLGQSAALNGIGHILRAQRSYREAIDYLHQDLAICQELGDMQGAGLTLHHLGDVEHDRRAYPAAVSYYEQSLDLYREVGDHRGEAQSLNCLGRAHDALGHHEQAAASWEAAIARYEQLGAPEAAEVRAQLRRLTGGTD